VWIKEENKWKVEFKILEGLFESTVMFYGLTDSLATFQTMVNEILWDLINTRDMASFIDNVIVEMEKEEGHNEVVEEIVI